MDSNAYYLIESGKALELIKQHIADRIRASSDVRTLLKQIAAEAGLRPEEISGRIDTFTGVMMRVEFPSGKRPDGFTVPDSNGCSRPKKNSQWRERFDAQRGHEPASMMITEAFQVPGTIRYESKAGWGARCLGHPFAPCHFLWLSIHHGPFALVIPDVQAAVQQVESDGYTVTSSAKEFSMDLQGCRRISQDEWEILVLQQKIREKRCDGAPLSDAQGAADERAAVSQPQG